MFPRIFTCLTFLFCTSCVMNDEVTDKQSELQSVTIKRGNNSNSTNAVTRETSKKSQITTASAQSSTRPVPSQSKANESGQTVSEIKMKDLVDRGSIARSTLSADQDAIGLETTTPETKISVVLRTAGDIVQMSPIFFVGLSVVRAFLNLVFVRV